MLPFWPYRQGPACQHPQGSLAGTPPPPPAQQAPLGSLGIKPGPKPHPPGSLGYQGLQEGLVGPEPPEREREGVSSALLAPETLAVGPGGCGQTWEPWWGGQLGLESSAFPSAATPQSWDPGTHDQGCGAGVLMIPLSVYGGEGGILWSRDQAADLGQVWRLSPSAQRSPAGLGPHCLSAFTGSAHGCSQKASQPAQKPGRVVMPRHPSPGPPCVPHSPPSPCGQLPHAPRARQRLPAQGEAERRVGGIRGLGGWGGVGKGWGTGGEGVGDGWGRWEDLLGRRALLRGRPLPARQRGPAQDARALSAHTAPPARPGAAPAHPPGQRSHIPVLPSRPWTLLVPGGPARVRGQGCGTRSRAPQRGPVPLHQPPLGDPGAWTPISGTPKEARALTGSPLGPFSPGAPLRPDSPCGRSGTGC